MRKELKYRVRRTIFLYIPFITLYVGMYIWYLVK